MFEWLVMLFSLTIAHSNLMIVMNNILCALIGSFVEKKNDEYAVLANKR